MCGIYAYLSKKNITENDILENEKWFQKIQHRGPDISAIHTFNNVFLGFHRLSIIGVESNNSLLNDNDVYLSCNGEIYNYKKLINKYDLQVKSKSDCEVILQLYLKNKDKFYKYINELDGVFAFILFDKKLNTVYVARDRIGVRPVFESINENIILFSSEGKSINNTNVIQFKPGYVKKINMNNLHIEEFYWVNENNKLEESLTDCHYNINKLLVNSVYKRLHSERPIGFLLSGGLDSSIITSIASRKLGKITTFSIGLPGSTDLKAANEVANYINSEHHEIIIRPHDIIECLPEVIKCLETFDITTIRASIPMYLLSKYISLKTDIKVIFSGEGSDELFGGYLYFHNAPNASEFQKETERLLGELYKYDVLRSDRTVSYWGLELRVPFLDKELLNYVKNIKPELKMCNPIEKQLLRDSFVGYLPHNLLYRQKEAFSDGVGYNSVSELKKYSKLTDYNLDTSLCKYAIPNTSESKLYFDIFYKFYGQNKNLYTEYYWMPKWVEADDPSATILKVHE